MLGKLLSRKKFFIVGLKQLASLLESNISRNQSEIAIFSPFSGLKSLLLATHYVGLVGADENLPVFFRAHFMRPYWQMGEFASSHTFVDSASL